MQGIWWAFANNHVGQEKNIRPPEVVTDNHILHTLMISTSLRMPLKRLTSVMYMGDSAHRLNLMTLASLKELVVATTGTGAKQTF